MSNLDSHLDAIDAMYAEIDALVADMDAIADDAEIALMAEGIANMPGHRAVEIVRGVATGPRQLRAAAAAKPESEHMRLADELYQIANMMRTATKAVRGGLETIARNRGRR